MSTVSVFYHRPRKSFYARVYIPVSLRSFFQHRVQCWRSLGTKDKKVATVKASIWNSRLQRLFYTLQTRGHRMDQAQIEALITRWMFATLDLCEDSRAERLPGMTDDEVDDQWTGCAMAVDESTGMLLSGDYAGAHREIQELLFSATLPALDVASPSYARLARAYLSARQRVYSVEMDRWSGNYRSSLAATAALPATPTPDVPVVPTKPFSEVATLYLKEHHTRRPRTQSMIESAFKDFLKVIGGDKPLGDISKNDCRAYKSKLVAAYLKASTINKHLHSLDHLFRWAKGQGYVLDTHVNPVTGLRIAKSIQKKEASKREAFTKEELQILVSHPLFTTERTSIQHPLWTGLLHRPEKDVTIFVTRRRGNGKERTGMYGLNGTLQNLGIANKLGKPLQ
jgi:hypothetical protein